MPKKKSIPDRTLVLRICDERLQARLREKMAAVEEEEIAAAAEAAAAAAASQNSNNNRPVSTGYQYGSSMSMSAPTKQETKILDLPGVTIEPAVQPAPSPYSSSYLHNDDNADPTLWYFTCDGASYPARLTNLPCPVELHKTHDHAMYYKCTDVAQMLIVYGEMTELEEAESQNTPNAKYKVDGFPSYYHSGLTPPTSRIVEKRFKERQHSAVPPPVEEIRQVERELIELMESISTKGDGQGQGHGAAKTKKNSNKNKAKKNTKPALNRVIEKVEEVVVDYEPWMDAGGEIPDGVEFDEHDILCKQHPEVWLDPLELREEAKQAENSSASGGGGGKSKKSSTPDAPLLAPASASASAHGDMKFSSDSVTTSSKKKKTKSTEKKKKKTKKKKSTPAEMDYGLGPGPSPSLAPTPGPGDGTGTGTGTVNNLDEVDLNLDVLDNFDFEGGLDGLGELDDDDLFNLG